MTTYYLDVYAINDDGESDADSMFYATADDTDALQRALSDALAPSLLNIYFTMT